MSDWTEDQVEKVAKRAAEAIFRLCGPCETKPPGMNEGDTQRHIDFKPEHAEEAIEVLAKDVFGFGLRCFCSLPMPLDTSMIVAQARKGNIRVRAVYMPARVAEFTQGFILGPRGPVMRLDVLGRKL